MSGSKTSVRLRSGEAFTRRTPAVTSGGPPGGKFDLLDGLRGVAALIVVVYHFSKRVQLHALFAHGYLAVDFFFALSGYVIAHAYLVPLQNELRFSRFLTIRLVRLLPMLAPGTLVGAIMELGRPGAGLHGRHLLEIMIALPLGCLAIPYPAPTTMEATIFPINGPTWSIFFELVANAALVAMLASRSGARLVLPAALASAIALGAVAISHGDVDVGALLSDWPGGFARVMVSFLAGILVYRWRERFVAFPAWWFPFLLAGLFLVPRLDGLQNVAFDMVAVVLAMPVLVGCAARSIVSDRARVLCATAGSLSYPVYAVHYPIIRFVSVLTNRYAELLSIKLIILASTIFIILFIARVLHVHYELPVRRGLRSLLLSDRVRGQAPSSRASPDRAL